MKLVRQRVRVFAPATVANVCCGFDVLGFALDEPGDEVIACSRMQPGVTIESIEGDEGDLPLDPARNTAGVAASLFLESIGAGQGVALRLIKRMPIRSGLGSSAASAVAAAVAVNALFGDPLTRQALMPFVLEAERVACGAAHADNVAPALLGGFVLVRAYRPLDLVPLPVPGDLYCALVHPRVEVSTKAARALLPQNLPLADAVTHWGNTAGLVAGLFRGDLDLVGRAMVDLVAEPVRAALIPHFHQIKAAALGAGALGCGISGSGPTIFALTRGRTAGERVLAAMAAAYGLLDPGLGIDTFLSAINSRGPRLIETEDWGT